MEKPWTYEGYLKERKEFDSKGKKKDELKRQIALTELSILKTKQRLVLHKINKYDE